jgi:hypothetical protein
VKPATIDCVVAVELRPGAGAALPAAFTWQGRRHVLVGLGRSWDEGPEGEWRCILAQTGAGDTVELRRHARTGEWRLARAWQRPAIA